MTPFSAKSSPRHPSDLNKCHQCPYDDCGKSFNRPAKLNQHLRSHTNTRPFVCPYSPCTKDFLRDSHLKHHIKSAHSGVRDFICEWKDCGKTFITATRLRRHHAAHEGREKFRCTILDCGQTFRKHGTLQKHITIVHEGKNPFTCSELKDDGQECGAGFDTEVKLRSHVGRFHESKAFICTLCSLGPDSDNADTHIEEREVVFSSHAALQAHLSNKHPPTCTECGLKCTSQSALKSHVEVIHGNLSIDERKSHVCPEPDCGLGFTKKGNLNAHVQISHTGKRFVCGGVDPRTLNSVADWDGSDACGELTTSKKNLERHIRAVHLGLESSGKAKKRGKRGNAGNPSKNEVPLLTRLTGVGYDTQSGRSIICLVQDCDYRFTRDYDLEIHLQSRHGLGDVEIQRLLVERDPRSQTSLGRLSEVAMNQIDGGFNGCSSQIMYDTEMDDYEKNPGTVAPRDLDSRQSHQGIGSEHPDHWWLYGEELMQRLSVGNQGDVEMLDPSLR